jgi:cysteine-rich repeat protein
MLLPRAAVLCLITLLLAGRSANATVATDLCPAAANPCTITVDRTIDPGSTLDFGTRTLIVNGGRSLDVGPGIMIIKAGALTLLPNGKLLGAGGFISVTVTGAIQLQSAGSTVSKIDASSLFGGGEIDLNAGADVTIDGPMDVKSDDTEEDGGDIFIQAGGDVQVTQPMTAKGGADAGGGTITILSGGNLNVTEAMDVSAGEFDGGDIDLEAQGSLTVGVKGDMDISGASLSGSGGSVELDAFTGNLSMSGDVLGTAGGSVEEGGGFGGEFDATATLGSLSLLGNITMFGGDGGGGGDGGDVSLTAGGPLTIGANIDTNGGVDTTTQGFGDGGGGSLAFQGCDVTLTAGHTVTALGVGFGFIDFKAGRQMTVAGTLASTQGNLLEYRDPAKPPIVTGSVTPPAQLSQSCTVPACAGLCGNHVLDVCETCDDGNTASGDCCSPTCVLNVAGTPCSTGVCNATGQCVVPPPTTTTSTTTSTIPGGTTSTSTSTTSTSTSSTTSSSTSSTTSTSTSTSTTSTSTTTSTSSTSSTTTTTPSTSTTSTTTLPPGCATALRKAAGKKINAKLGCHAKAKNAAQAVDPNCLTKAETAFNSAFAKGRCPGTPGPFEALADACVTQLLSDVPGNGKCPSSSTKAIGSGAGGMLTCSSKDIKKPGTAPACQTKAAAKLAGKLAKAGVCAAPDVLPDLSTCVQTIEAVVR